MKKGIFLVLLLSIAIAVYAASVSVSPAEGVAVSGQTDVAAAGTAVILGHGRCISVIIRADTANTNDIYVGDSSVDSSTGYVLDAGEWVSLDVSAVSKIYIDADTNGEGVSYIAIR